MTNDNAGRGGIELDVRYWRHPVIVHVGRKAAASNLVAMAWEHEYGMGGLIPRSALKVLRIPISRVEKLVDAGIWEASGDGWIVYHDRGIPNV